MSCGELIKNLILTRKLRVFVCPYLCVKNVFFFARALGNVSLGVSLSACVVLLENKLQGESQMC